MGVTGTLLVWKSSSLAGSLLGGLFSFSKKKAICTGTEGRTTPCHLAIITYFQKGPRRLKSGKTHKMLVKGREKTGQATNETLRQTGEGEEKNNRSSLRSPHLLT